MRYLRVALAAAWLLCFGYAAAFAQQPPAPTLPFGVYAVGTASPISVTTSSAATALPAASVTVFVLNQGPNAVCVGLGGSSVAVVCPGGTNIPAGQMASLGMAASTYIAAATRSGTATLSVITGYLQPIYNGALPAGSATAANQATQITAEQAIQATAGAISGNAAITPNDSSTVSVGRQFLIACTVAGNVKVAFSDSSTLTIPVAVGLSILPWAVIQVFVTGTTATATYANLL